VWPNSFFTAAAISDAFAFGLLFSMTRIAKLLFFFGSVRSDLDSAGFLAIVFSNVK
jgi:hypothetical protein